MSNDHRTDIRKSATSYTAEAAGILSLGWDDSDDAYERFNEFVLDVEHTSKHSGSELIPDTTTVVLTIGGPTVTVKIDHRYGNVTFRHSWGEYMGEERTDWDLDSDGRSIWDDLAEQFAPHPADLFDR